MSEYTKTQLIASMPMLGRAPYAGGAAFGHAVTALCHHWGFLPRYEDRPGFPADRGRADITVVEPLFEGGEKVVGRIVYDWYKAPNGEGYDVTCDWSEPLPEGYDIYHYRAWALNHKGEPISGVEEELLAKSHRAANRMAWRRATDVLVEGGSGSVQMEYIERGYVQGV